jgi:alpha-methylacyl-CoA racemase
MLFEGVLAAFFEHTSGRGQVIDAAMVDGSALLTTMLHSFRQRSGPKRGYSTATR